MDQDLRAAANDNIADMIRAMDLRQQNEEAKNMNRIPVENYSPADHEEEP